MFKLIKILNSGSNVPEPCRIPTGGLAFKAGAALTVADGTAAPCGATQAPKFIAMANAEATDTDVICYPVTPDMLFSVKVQENPAALKLFDKVTLYVDSDGMATGVTATTSSGVATVTDLEGAEAAGDTITVKFA